MSIWLIITALSSASIYSERWTRNGGWYQRAPSSRQNTFGRNFDPCTIWRLSMNPSASHSPRYVWMTDNERELENYGSQHRLCRDFLVFPKFFSWSYLDLQKTEDFALPNEDYGALMSGYPTNSNDTSRRWVCGNVSFRPFTTLRLIMEILIYTGGGAS